MHLHGSFSCRSFYVRQIIRFYPKAPVVTAHITDVLTIKNCSMLQAKFGPNAYLVMVANLIEIWGEKFRFALADPWIFIPSSFGHMQSCSLLQIYPVYRFLPAEIFHNRSEVTHVRKSLCKVSKSSLQNLHCNDPTVMEYKIGFPRHSNVAFARSTRSGRHLGLKTTP